MSFDAIDRQFRRKAAKPKCICCSTTEGVELRLRMTAYHWDGAIDDPENPNAPWLGCPNCAEDYRREMQSQWDDYYAGLL